MLAKKIAINTIISAAARILGTALALVTIGLITRSLSKTEWGEYSIVLTFGGIFAVLADLGLYQLMVREISKEGADEQKIASQIFSLRLIVSLFIFALAPLASLFFPYSSSARWAILVGMIGFWFLSGSQVLMGPFQKYLRMGKVAWAELAGRVAQLALVFVFIKLQSGFLWIVAALAFSSLFNFLLIYLMVQRYIRVKFAIDLAFWKVLLRTTYPLAISNVLVMIYFSTDALILSVFWPAADVGVYRLPYKILESLIFFPSMFVGLIMPYLTRSAFSDESRFKQIFQRGYDVLTMAAAPLVLGTFFVSPAIISLLGGSKYTESVPVLNILIVATGFIFFGALFSFTLIALEKQKTLLKISAVGAVFNLIFNLIFIPRYSYYAAAWGTVLTEALVTVLMLAAIYQVRHFWPKGKVFLKSFLAACPMCLFLWYFRNLNLFIILAAATAIYLTALYLVKGFSKEEILKLVIKNNG